MFLVASLLAIMAPFIHNLVLSLTVTNEHRIPPPYFKNYIFQKEGQIFVPNPNQLGVKKNQKKTEKLPHPPCFNFFQKKGRGFVFIYTT